MNDNFFLKSIFSEIICGFSPWPQKSCYIKHSSPLYSFELEEIYKHNYDLASSRGLPTNEKQLEYLAENSLWTEEDNNIIKDKKLYIHGLKTSRSKALLSKEREFFNEEIKKTEDEILKLEFKKQNLLGLTCETFANKKGNEFSILKSLYKDKQLIKPYFTEKEFYEIEDNQLNEIIKFYNDLFLKFGDKNIKQVAVSPFFLNIFSLCDNNPNTFFGKPIIQLTYYQVDLFYNGCLFKNILSEMKDKISPELLSDPEKLVAWYESGKNFDEIQKFGIAKGEGAVRSVMGASKEDRKIMNQNVGIDVVDVMKQRGKSKLSMKDLIKIHGLS